MTSFEAGSCIPVKLTKKFFFFPFKWKYNMIPLRKNFNRQERKEDARSAILNSQFSILNYFNRPTSPRRIPR